MYNESMLQLSAYLHNRPVLSLRNGRTVAWAGTPIFNPHNLRIEGFHVIDSQDGRRLVLLSQDIRELSKQGFIVDDHDVLSPLEDLIRLQDILQLNFELLKKPVVTVSKTHVGKVNDYAVETSSMYVQKLYVSQSFWKSLTGGNLSVDRTQIVEITNRRIVINDLLQGTPAAATAAAAT